MIDVPPPLSPTERAALLGGRHRSPHDLLGAHPITAAGREGIVIRAHHPDAVAVDALLSDGRICPLTAAGSGLFAGVIPNAHVPMTYRLRFGFADGAVWERDDPYRFQPSVGDLDLHLFNEGTHRRLWECLGAQHKCHQGTWGVGFAVWAPTAQRVSVVGEFCRWDGRVFPMRQLGSSGVFELFVPDLTPGTLYKFEILTARGALRLKTDPYARAMEHPPETAAIVTAADTYVWQDRAWMAARSDRDLTREPMLIYEVHLASWMRADDGQRPLTYRELAPKLAAHVRRLGCTHVELLPIMEHPFSGSWGYQVSGYYAPTARHGTPDDFRWFVDTLHQAGVGVLLDWVPAHFPKDDFALRRFDGSALYEHDDPRLGEHPDWGTLIFNYGRTEVRNFLIANALYWLDVFHIDGLRVDAVASLLYLDYSRKAGEWIPNRYGGRENLAAIEFLRAMHTAIEQAAPGCITIAEESTSWGGVTRRVQDGGLGFTFKWNMGWMHDTLGYFERAPIHRRWHQNDLTFSMLYEHSERFINPLSHDEVVHGKRSLLDKMPGDVWQKFANLRLLLAYQYMRPGKVLLFMGTELAPWSEWNHDASLDWHLASDPERAGFVAWMQALGESYRTLSALWRRDADTDGFAWIDCRDAAQSVFSFLRRDGTAHCVVVLNATPTPHDGYRIGVPQAGTYRERLNSDAAAFGGSGYPTVTTARTEPVPWHGHPQSIRLALPPLAALLLTPE